MVVLTALKSWFATLAESAWQSLRAEWLAEHGECEACGTRDDLDVHHIQPVHVDDSRRYDSTNLITLCRRHHFLFGHLENWASWNANVRDDAKVWRARLRGRPMIRGEEGMAMFQAIFWRFLRNFLATVVTAEKVEKVVLYVFDLIRQGVALVPGEVVDEPIDALLKKIDSKKVAEYLVKLILGTAMPLIPPSVIGDVHAEYDTDAKTVIDQFAANLAALEAAKE